MFRMLTNVRMHQLSALPAGADVLVSSIEGHATAPACAAQAQRQNHHHNDQSNLCIRHDATCRAQCKLFRRAGALLRSKSPTVPRVESADIKFNFMSFFVKFGGRLHSTARVQRTTDVQGLFSS